MATSTYFVNGVGIGIPGNSSGLNALSISLNGTNISNIFITSNVLSNTSNKLYNYTSNSSNLLQASKQEKIIAVTPLNLDITTNNLSLNYNTNDFTLSNGTF